MLAGRWVIPEWPAGTTVVLALLSFQASRNCLVAISSQDPDSPAFRKNMPLWVRVHRVMVQPEAVSQHPVWCEAQPALLQPNSVTGGVSLVLASRVVLFTLS